MNIKEIKEYKCFACCDKDKRPVNPKTGKLITRNEKNLRWNYGECKKAIKEFSNITGISILTGEYSFGNLCVLDIDNCFESGTIKAQALKTIKMINSYTELSLSKNGIHCYFFAKKKTKRCVNNSLSWCKCLELYDAGKPFIFTENTIIDETINHRQQECNLLIDKYFNDDIAKHNVLNKHNTLCIISTYETDKKKLLRGISQNGTLKELWNGNRKSSDESSNDLAFFNSLRYFSNGNISLMKEFFLNSPYFEQKDDLHKKKCTERSDYLERTIQKSFN